MAALRRCGVFELHAAGAVEPESGRGLLFIGPSGCGKSTLATRLAAAGFHYLSDDLHLLRESGGAVEARALRRVFGVNGSPASASALEGRAESFKAAGPFDPDKLYFDPETLFPGRFRESCVPRAIFFPEVTDEHASVTRALTQSEAMARLIRMCPWAGYDLPAARAHLGVLARLARQAAAYELRAGRDMLGDSSFAASFFRARVGGATM
jgi:energy-coupling factor transporter ATP-binding protein EcfA2